VIEILSAGVAASVQDLGRTGYLGIGVGGAGAMDRLALQAANLLAGNAPGAAAIENAAGTLRIRFTKPCAFAVAGAPARVGLDGMTLPSFWSMTAAAEQVLEVAPSPSGMWTYLALAGGIDAAPVLGSRSTDLKAGFGGHEGRSLAPGDRLATCALPAVAGRAGGFGVVPPPMGAVDEAPTAVRAMPAREHDRFCTSARAAFWDAEWVVQADSNRIGYRLAGPILELIEPLSLLSYGLVPGVVQVPPSGQPVVQLSEANTCGGYPKMAVVVGADLRLLAQTRPGRTVRFVRCTREEAVHALREEQAYLAAVASCARGVMSGATC
jgi:biotin-dependent carboxylase-like uncharacterized protein